VRKKKRVAVVGVVAACGGDAAVIAYRVPRLGVVQRKLRDLAELGRSAFERAGVAARMKLG
jgi:hypothetical protein